MQVRLLNNLIQIRSTVMQCYMYFTYTHTPVAYLRVLLITFKILSVDEGLNPFLEVLCPDGKLELYEQLLHKQLVAQALACLHHTHNGRINLHSLHT